MDKIKFFLIGVIAVISLIAIMGASSPTEEIGRFQAIPVVAGGAAGLFVIDTKTGITKAVWGQWKGGQLGKSFSEIASAPK